MTIKNMFPIELRSIKGILEEANTDNLREFHALMSEIINLPNEIVDEFNAKQTLEIIEKIIKIEKNFRDSRLGDGKVFKEGLKAVEDFFKDYESPLKEKKLLLQERISDFANSSEAAEKSKPTSIRSIFSKPEKPVESEIDKNLNLNREWVISKIDIKELDLEALRSFFTENQLKMAINKHLKANGPMLDGVKYQKKVKL